MPICSHGSLDEFDILRSKFLEYILNVLSSADEGALLELLDLKSKEILQLPHHRHLEFLYHNPIKLFTR
jgi:succinate dehydrogenase flavin-adding protein (antitoxin of CptAB toxin-antitoxin module)